MAPMVTRTLTSGLVAAEEAEDETRLGRALKEIDDRYVLQGEVTSAGLLYRVLCVVSDDQPPVPIFSWTDDYGNPLPLSSGLLEAVKKWRPEARARRGPDADERNAALLEANERNREAAKAELNADHAPGITRSRTSVSMGPGSRKPGWQRRGVRPSSGGAS